MNKKERLRLLIVAVVLVAALFFVFPIQGRVKLGLDLSGGVHIVLRAVPQQGDQLDSDSVDRLMAVLRNRIDQYGVAEPLIQRSGTDRIIIDLPGMDDPEMALSLIGKTAQLEFRQVEKSTSQLPPRAERKNYDSDEEYNAAVERWNAFKAQQDQLLENMKAQQTDGHLIAGDEEGAIYELGQLYMTGDRLRNAQTAYDQLGRSVVSIEFDSEGSELFYNATKDNVGRQIAMVLDGVVISAPRVNEPISGGRAQISGNFSSDEARNLAIMLRAGALPVGVEVLENSTVGPSLGNDSIRSGQLSGIIGVGAVFLFMILFYRVMGVTACLSLLSTLLLLFAMMIMVGSTLTLPGIAGIILTIGMAVDSNILIFERMKEEAALGRSRYASITAGFTKVFSTIFDSNITTVIGAAVLFYIGSGPLRGFALTLTLGIIASMFSALMVNRVLLILLANYTKLPFAGAKDRTVA